MTSGEKKDTQHPSFLIEAHHAGSCIYFSLSRSLGFFPFFLFLPFFLPLSLSSSFFPSLSVSLSLCSHGFPSLCSLRLLSPGGDSGAV